MKIEEALSEIKELDLNAKLKAEKRWDSMAKPLKSFGLLEDAIIQIAGIQRSCNIDIKKKCAVIFCGDNGVTVQGVTQCGQEVTAKVTENLSDGVTALCRMARFAGASVIPVDIGVCRDVEGVNILNRKVAYGTEDITKGSAMTMENALKAVETGIDLAFELKEKGYKMLATGEMGIGNTTTSAAIASVLLKKTPEAVTGKGAGLSDSGLMHKIDIVRKAVEVNSPDPNNPLDVLHKLGGYDIAGMTGLFIGGAAAGTAVVIDGVISSAAALLAVMLDRRISDYILPSHLSAETVGKAFLDSLGKKPLITAEMRMGEGTGAVLSFLLYDMAAAVYNETSTFEDVNIEPYKPL